MIEADISEYREHEKYVKFFTSKVLHTVVQSRSGFIAKTKCNADARGRDWFNIALMDCDSAENLQSVVREKFGKKAAVLSNPISLDIILKNSEGKYRFLESWCIHCDPLLKDGKIRNHFSVYNRLGVLLRSVISISRILPSFRLSKRENQDFNLFWRLKCTSYEVNEFELSKKIDIGSVCTPIGTIKVNVLYRSKIELTDFTNTQMIFSDDITDENKLFPLNQNKNISKFSFTSVPLLEKEIASAVSDNEFLNVKTNFNEKEKRSFPYETVDAIHITNENANGSAIPAFADIYTELPCLELPELSCSPPFLSLLTNNEEEKFVMQQEALTEVKDITNQKKTIDITSNVPKQAEAVGFEDDFVLVELRPAFCLQDDSIGALYKEWKNPVALDLFSTLEQEDAEAGVLNVSAEIEKYKKELEECKSFFLSVK